MDLLTDESRAKLQDILIKYFLVDSLRNSSGDLNEAIKTPDVTRQYIENQEPIVKKKVLAMNDNELIQALVGAHQGPKPLEN